MPGGLAMWRTGHQVQSLLSPPTLSSGLWPGARLRISCSKIGLTAFGFGPAYCSRPGNSTDRPTNEGGIGRPTAARSTVNTLAPRGAAPAAAPALETVAASLPALERTAAMTAAAPAITATATSAAASQTRRLGGELLMVRGGKSVLLLRSTYLVGTDVGAGTTSPAKAGLP